MILSFGDWLIVALYFVASIAIGLSTYASMRGSAPASRCVCNT